MDILGPLPKMSHANPIIVVIMDRYSKLTRAILTPKPTAIYFPIIFLDHWVMPYGITTFVLIHNGPQFVSKFFSVLCGFLKCKQLSSTA